MKAPRWAVITLLALFALAVAALLGTLSVWVPVAFGLAAVAWCYIWTLVEALQGFLVPKED